MDGTIDYGNFGAQDPNAVQGPNAPVSGGAPPPPASASSIQKSELEALALIMAAGIPILMPPSINGNGAASFKPEDITTAISMDVEAKKHEIISKMWDSYIENLREIADRIKRDDIKRETVDADKPGPKSSTEYFTYLMSVSATKKADEIDGNGLVVQFTNTFNQWMVNPTAPGTSSAVAGVSSTTAYPSASFIAGSVASNPDIVRASIGAESAFLGVQLSSSPVADALLAVGPTTGLPADYQAAAALVAALLNGGAMQRATVESMAANAGKPPQDLNFAVNYAKEVMAIVTKNIGAEDPTNPQRSEQNNMIRLMLSAMALNMLYRAAYGGMSGKEFENLLAGNTKDIPDAVREVLEQLVVLVNRYLPNDPTSRKDTIARLMEYVDSKDSVDSMLDTSRLFASQLQGDSVVANRLASDKT